MQIRRGDVLLERIEPPAGELTRSLDEQGQPLAGLVVEGERTGHAHVLPARVYDSAGGRLLFLERPTPITHEEHAAVDVPAGWWRVTQQREYVPRQAPRSRAWAD